MALPRYYPLLLSITLIMMCGVLLLLHDSQKPPLRNPGDVVWQERMRRNAFESLAPIRSRINIVRGQPTAIRVSGITTDLPAIVTVDLSERQLALDVIDAARLSVLESSGWVDNVPFAAPEAPFKSQRLFDLKDQLWDMTLAYIDKIRIIYARDGDVFSSEVTLLEDQIQTYMRLLDEEIDRQGLEPVE